jgi:hypothetical protein
MLLGPNGQPVVSEKAHEEMRSEGQANFEAVLGLLTERKVTNDQLADLIVNIYNVWCEHCAPGPFVQQNAMAVLATIANLTERWTIAKKADLKIRQNVHAANPGHKTQQ